MSYYLLYPKNFFWLNLRITSEMSKDVRIRTLDTWVHTDKPCLPSTLSSLLRFRVLPGRQVTRLVDVSDRVSLLFFLRSKQGLPSFIHLLPYLHLLLTQTWLLSLGNIFMFTLSQYLPKTFIWIWVTSCKCKTQSPKLFAWLRGREHLHNNYPVCPRLRTILPVLKGDFPSFIPSKIIYH